VSTPKEDWWLNKPGQKKTETEKAPGGEAKPERSKEAQVGYIVLPVFVVSTMKRTPPHFFLTKLVSYPKCMFPFSLYFSDFSVHAFATRICCTRVFVTGICSRETHDKETIAPYESEENGHGNCPFLFIFR
jgi:hypothetical protein